MVAEAACQRQPGLRDVTITQCFLQSYLSRQKLGLRVGREGGGGFWWADWLQRWREGAHSVPSRSGLPGECQHDEAARLHL